jgi:flagellar motor switch protein FliN
MADQNPDLSAAPAAAAPPGGGVESAETIATDALRSAEQAVTALAGDGSGGATTAAAPAAAGTASAPDGAKTFDMPSFDQNARQKTPSGMQLLADVNLNVKIELGRTRMLVEDVLRLGEGSVVELDKLAGDPVDVYVNERPVARGEVLVLNDNFCVRINEIISNVASGGA